jgi:hypothetical protein
MFLVLAKHSNRKRERSGTGTFRTCVISAPRSCGETALEKPPPRTLVKSPNICSRRSLPRKSPAKSTGDIRHRRREVSSKGRRKAGVVHHLGVLHRLRIPPGVSPEISSRSLATAAPDLPCEKSRRYAAITSASHHPRSPRSPPKVFPKNVQEAMQQTHPRKCPRYAPMLSAQHLPAAETSVGSTRNLPQASPQEATQCRVVPPKPSPAISLGDICRMSSVAAGSLPRSPSIPQVLARGTATQTHASILSRPRDAARGAAADKFAPM